MSYRRTEFDKLNDQFQDTAAELLNNPTTNALENVLDCYNAIIVYAEVDYERKHESTREYITETVQANRITVQECFEKLKLPVILPGKLLSTIHYILKTQDDSKPSINLSSQITQTDQVQSTSQIAQTDQIEQLSQIAQTDLISLTNQNTQTSKMPQTIDDFMKYTQSILNYQYKGDPLDLNGFISDAKLLYSLAKTEESKEFCLTYIKNRVRGRAEEYIPEGCNSVEALLSALKNKIKPESSAIVEGKILSLRLQKNDYTKFAQDAEKLSEAFRRALIVEGITKAKAEEMTVNKTVDLCISSTKLDRVKTVLEATKFDSPADVIAKFVTQSDKVRRELKDQQPSNSKGQTDNNNSLNRKKAYKKDRFSKNYNRSENRYENRSDNRSGYRSNNGQRNQRGQRQNRGRNDNNRSNRNEQTIRIIAGNPPSTTVEQPQPQEQFFRLEN